jgi:hypothetical protein
MPITSFLDGEQFDPETRRVLGVALEMTCPPALAFGVAACRIVSGFGSVEAYKSDQLAGNANGIAINDFDLSAVIVRTEIVLHTMKAYVRTLGLEDEIKHIESKSGTKIPN